MALLGRAAAAALVVATLAGVATAAAPRPLEATLIASDPLPQSAPGQHATTVEPDSFSWGSKTVSVFQVGRNPPGGANAIGFATSTDFGRTWSSGLLPGLTPWSPSPAPAQFASDPVVAYDAAHRQWLASSLAAAGGLSRIYVSRSSDGLVWEPPVVARSAPPSTLDKEWMVCDNGPRSPFRGNCYVATADFERVGFRGNVRVAVSASKDGGATWSEPVLIPVDYNGQTDTLGPFPVVRPNGELVVVFTERFVLKAVRSTNGALEFSQRERIADFREHPFSFHREGLRAPPLPAADVDGAGTIYVAWHDCRFRPRCSANDIVLSRSSKRGRWTAPIRLPLGARRATTDFTLPAVSVDRGSRGKKARIAVAYYGLSTPDCVGPSCQLVAGLATSATGGRRWTVRRVGAPMQLGWLASTSIGRMVGDYVSVSFLQRPVRSRLVPHALAVYVLARPPQNGRFDEAVHAATVPVR